MTWLSFDDLERESADLDAAAAASPDIDVFCSSADWTLPAHAAFGAAREPLILRGDDVFAAFAIATAPGGARVLQPLEATWGLASSVLGPRPREAARELAAALAQRRPDWQAAFITGIASGSATFRAVAEELSSRFRVFAGPAVRRSRIRLEADADAFVARRSKALRRTLRRATDSVKHARVTFERVGDTHDATRTGLLDRILSVEARSWKGLAGSGILADPMRAFYARMMDRLARRGGLRVLFARRDGLDVGYVLGGVRGLTYRGLQFSYDDELAACGLGNAMQLEQLRWSAAEGCVLYDLGVEAEYKRRWSDESFETVTLLLTS